MFYLLVFGKIWVVAENMLTGLEIADGKVTIVDKFFGYSSLALDIKKGVFPMSEVRALVVCIGRAEAFARNLDFLTEATNLMDAVKECRPAAVIYFTSPVPHRSDDVQRVRKLHGFGMQLRAMLYNRQGAHYLDLVESLTNPAGFQSQMWTERQVSTEGLKWIAKHVEQAVAQWGPPQLQDLKVTVDF